MIKFYTAPGGGEWGWGRAQVHIGNTLEICLYLARRPKVTKLCMWSYLVGFYQACPSYGHEVKVGPARGSYEYVIHGFILGKL